MSTHTTVRNPGAIALGSLFAIGTACALFWDVRSAADITIDHVMTGLVLIGTIAAGKMFGPALSRKAWHQAFGLAVLFAAGTFICVTGSAGRNAEVGQHKAAEARNVNDARARIEGDLTRAQTDRADLNRRMASECATGRGKRCEGLRTTIEYADSHIAVLEAMMAKLQPEQTENGGLHHAAKVFAMVLPARVDAVEGALVLLWPFAKAMMLEVATIVFFSIGLGHGNPARRSVAGPSIADTAQTSFPAGFPAHFPAIETFAGDVPEPPRPPRRGRKSKKLPANVVAFRQSTAHPVVAAIEGAGRPLSNRDLASVMGVSEGEASKRWQEVAHLLDVGRAGKELRLSLRATA